MLKRLKTLMGLAVLAGAVAGCGAVYIPSEVSQADGKVRIIPLTPETVLAANRSEYRPRALPAVFSQAAGLSGTTPGGGALPAPVLDPQSRPAQQALRLPPTPPRRPYEIGVGDELILATRSAGGTVEELTGLLAAQNRRQGYTVQDDGTIAIPDVGRVPVAGLTLEQAEDRLFQQLLEKQIDPTFSLEIAAFNSKRVSIGGAVGKPAVVPVTLVELTLDQALAAAGGVQTADLDYASIRLYREGTLYQIPLEAYLSRPELQKTRLVAGDSIFVDTEYDLAQAQAWFSQQITLTQARAQARQQALSTLQAEVALRRAALDERRESFRTRLDLDAVGRDYVYLTGEVRTPSRFPLPFERQATLADALYAEGGFSQETANPAQIYVLRGSDDPRDFGAVTAWQLDARNAANLTLATRMELRPNDVIFVAEQPVARWNRAMRLIIPSLITTTVARSVD